MDTASRKQLFLGIGAGNSDPKVIGRWYFECRKIPSIIWLDKGTEKGLLGTIHACLRDQHGDMDAVDTVIFGKSTSNQVKFATKLAEFEQIKIIYHWLRPLIIQENVLKKNICIFCYRLKGGGENYMRDWRNIIKFI